MFYNQTGVKRKIQVGGLQTFVFVSANRRVGERPAAKRRVGELSSSQVHVSQLVDMVESKFQRHLPCVRLWPTRWH